MSLSRCVAGQSASVRGAVGFLWSGGAGFREEPNTVPASALWKCSGKSVASLGACTLCGLSGRPEELPEMVREYFRWRLEEALEVLPTDSAKLAEVLNELFALLAGEDEVEG